MSDTPRTDAAEFAEDGGASWVVTADFARQLERENKELLEALKEICAMYTWTNTVGEVVYLEDAGLSQHMVEKIRAIIAKAEGK
jgi:hypothetical protein